ncbi:hypothetical protein ACA910_014418 [Epithemia clementina (nom. ined.)]
MSLSSNKNNGAENEIPERRPQQLQQQEQDETEPLLCDASSNSGGHGDWKDFFRACGQGDLILIRQYLQYGGVDMHFQHPEYMSAPIFEAIRNGQADAVDCLVQHAAARNKNDVSTLLLNREYFSDCTPMEYALAEQRHDMVDVFLRYFPHYLPESQRALVKTVAVVVPISVILSSSLSLPNDDARPDDNWARKIAAAVQARLGITARKNQTVNKELTLWKIIWSPFSSSSSLPPFHNPCSALVVRKVVAQLLQNGHDVRLIVQAPLMNDKKNCSPIRRRSGGWDTITTSHGDHGVSNNPQPHSSCAAAEMLLQDFVQSLQSQTGNRKCQGALEIVTNDTTNNNKSGPGGDGWGASLDQCSLPAAVVAPASFPVDAVIVLNGEDQDKDGDADTVHYKLIKNISSALIPSFNSAKLSPTTTQEEAKLVQAPGDEDMKVDKDRNRGHNQPSCTPLSFGQQHSQDDVDTQTLQQHPPRLIYLLPPTSKGNRKAETKNLPTTTSASWIKFNNHYRRLSFLLANTSASCVTKNERLVPPDLNKNAQPSCSAAKSSQDLCNVHVVVLKTKKENARRNYSHYRLVKSLRTAVFLASQWMHLILLGWWWDALADAFQDPFSLSSPPPPRASYFSNNSTETLAQLVSDHIVALALSSPSSSLNCSLLGNHTNTKDHDNDKEEEEEKQELLEAVVHTMECSPKQSSPWSWQTERVRMVVTTPP